MPETIKSYMKVNMFCLKLLGLWQDRDDFFGANFYWIYCIFINIFVVGSFNFCQVMYYVINIGNLEILARTGYVALLFLMANVKSYFYLKNWSLIRDLVGHLDHPDFQPKTERQRKNAHLLLRTQKGIHLFCEAEAVTVIIVWVLVPLLQKGAQIKLPFFAWYPYDTESSYFTFIFTYVHQSIALLFISQMNISFDMLVYAFNMFVGTECDILSDKLKNLYEHTKQKMQKEQQGLEFESSDEDPAVLLEMEYSLYDCLTFHKKILRFAAGTNEFLSSLVFLQFSTSLLTICLCLLAITEASEINSELIAAAMFLIVNVTEILFYCTFGNEVIFRSSRASDALYESLWINCSESYKKKILFFMTRTQKPIRMYALNFFVISLPTYLQILRTSYSFFAMLYQVRRRESQSLM